MSNSIGRIRTIGIAAQPTFGTAVITSTFVLPVLNATSIVPVINKLRNEAALSSAYTINDIENGNRMASMSIEAKIDEDHLPLLLKQRFSITSTTASGDANAYEHTLTFNNSTNSWYTIMLEDDNRTSYYMQDVLLPNMNITLDGEFVRFSSEVMGKYPVTWGGSNTVVQPKEFVGRMVTFNIADDGGSVAAQNVLNAAANLTFGLNGDDTKYHLGDQELGTHELTQDVYEFEVTALEPDRNYYDDFTANTAKEFDFTIESEDRYISGTTITRPFIKFDVPYAKIEEWAEDAPLDDLIRQTFKLTALDRVGEANAPMQIVVRNNTATY